MLPRRTTRLWYFWNLGSNSAFVRWQMSINVAKWTFFLSLCASRITSFLLFNFVQLPGWNRFELLPFRVHCCFSIWNFHRLRHRNTLVRQIVMSHRVVSFACDMIFMIFRWRLFQTLSRGLMGLHDASTLCLWNLVGFTTLRFSLLEPGVLLCSSFAKHCRLHRNLRLSLCIFDDFFMFSIFRIDEIIACLRALLSFGLSFGYSCFSFFWASFPILDQSSDHKFSGLVVAWMSVNLLPDHIYIPLEVFLSTKWTSWIHSKNPIDFESRPHSNYRQCVFSCNTSRFV